MKPLILALLACCSVSAQTIKPNDKNVDQCFKRSSKTTEAFERCVTEEFERVRDEKRLAELRANDPPGTFHCNPSNTSSKNLRRCLDIQMARLQESRESLYELPASSWRFLFPPYYPHYYPRSYVFLYPRRYFVPLRIYRRF